MGGLYVDGGLFVHAFSHKMYFNGLEHIFLKLTITHLVVQDV